MGRAWFRQEQIRIDSNTRSRMVILGDSITAGCCATGVTPQTAWPSLLHQSLKASGVAIDLVVSALHGVYVNYAIRRFDRMVAQKSPDYVVILLGSNDCCPTATRAASTRTEFRDDMSSLIDHCLLQHAVPIVVSPPPRSDCSCCRLLEEYAETLNSSEITGKAEVIDLFHPFAEAGPVDRLLPDGLHPNPAGNQVIVNVVADHLVEILSRRTMNARRPELSVNAGC